MSREPLAPARRYTQPAALDQFQVDLGAKLFYCLFLNSISQVFRRGQGICGAERRGSTALIFCSPANACSSSVLRKIKSLVNTLNLGKSMRLQLVNQLLSQDGSEKEKTAKLLSGADQARDARKWGEAAELYASYLKLRRADAPIWVQYGHALKE
ncbi:MAG TPA: hypothetical protein VEK14_03190, partial [Rhodomicrobium sp.]|nr:hypothetical protein [Rhodomicrobium sp.]